MRPIPTCAAWCARSSRRGSTSTNDAPPRDLRARRRGVHDDLRLRSDHARRPGGRSRAARQDVEPVRARRLRRSARPHADDVRLHAVGQRHEPVHAAARRAGPAGRGARGARRRAADAQPAGQWPPALDRGDDARQRQRRRSEGVHPPAVRAAARPRAQCLRAAGVRRRVDPRPRGRAAHHRPRDRRVARVPEPVAQGDAVNRRKFLTTSLAGVGAAALAPLIKVRRSSAATTGNRVIIVGIGGGLRLRESLGMAEGATMPNLFGTAPLIPGFGTSAGAPKIAPEYAARMPALALPAPRATPLITQGTLITNLRYADGPPAHVRGHGCLLSGYYNKLENRADAHLPVPTVFELHRRATGAAATDAWYVSAIGGVYRAVINTEQAEYGSSSAGGELKAPGV